MRAAIYGVATLLAITSQSAFATLVRVDFAGSVERFSGEIFQLAGEPTPISPAEAEAALGGSIHVGTPFSGFFVYDDSAIPQLSDLESAGSPASANYYSPTDVFPGPGLTGFAAHGEVGSFVADGEVDHGDSASIEVFDSEVYLNGSMPSSIFITGGVSSPPAPEGAIALTLVRLYAAGGSPGSPLHGTSLHSIPWNLESFPRPDGNFVFQNGDLSVQVDGAVTRLVPEPAGVGPLAVAACALLAAMQRVRHRVRYLLASVALARRSAPLHRGV